MPAFAEYGLADPNWMIMANSGPRTCPLCAGLGDRL